MASLEWRLRDTLTHTHTHRAAIVGLMSLFVFLCGRLAPAQAAGGSATAERYLIVLRDRGFALGTQLQAIRSMALGPARQAAVSALRQAAAQDQNLIRLAAEAAGGSIDRHYWCVSAMSARLPAGAVAVLQAMPRVARVERVRSFAIAEVAGESSAGIAPEVAGSPAAAPPPPISVSTDALNHNVQEAWSILGGSPSTPYRGAGARVAVFDTGIDADVDGNNATPDPHPAFLDDAGNTRIDAFLQAQAVGTTAHADVNVLTTVAPWIGQVGPFGFRPGRHHTTAGHGTAMSSIIAGRSYGTPYGNFVGEGHVPDAKLVSVAISTFPVPPFGNGPQDLWTTTTEGYLGGIEQLREFILQNKPAGQQSAFVHVVNISYDGEPDPKNVVSMALDALARDEDVLLVTSAGNDPDQTPLSNGFYHGIAVGFVHARSAGDPTSTPPKPPNLEFVPMLQTAKGPLSSDHRRWYPDVCATGAGPGSYVTSGGTSTLHFRYPINFEDPDARGTCLLMPGIDILDPNSTTTYPNAGYNTSPVRYNLGTSEAAPQVSGAAALYRGYRASQGTPATAEETRAAILLNVLGTYVRQTPTGVTADPADQHTYNNRNRLGVGYVRDDLLAQFAVRDTAIKPLVTTVDLSAANPSADVTYQGLASNRRYGVVVCWRRWIADVGGDATGEGDLPNVDLEVFGSNGLIARSASEANSYERVVFIPPPTGGGNQTSATFHITLNSDAAPSQIVRVHVVAREFAPDVDPATQIADPLHAASGQALAVSAGSDCTAQSTSWRVDRIVPTSYANAYGSAPFQMTLAPNWAEHHPDGYARGSDLAMGRLTTAQSGQTPTNTVHFTIDSAVMGGAINLVGLAFRTWAPLSPSEDMVATISLWQGNFTTPLAGTVPPSGAPPSGATVVASNVLLKAPGPDSGAATMDRFVVTVPFTTNFSYNGFLPFHIWIQGSVPTGFLVDGLSDGAGSPYRTDYRVYDTLLGTYRAQQLSGQAPIIGLVAVSPVADREVTLELDAEPWSGNGSESRFVEWRLSQMPPSSSWGLIWGDWASSPTAFTPQCGLWLSNYSIAAGGVCGAAGMTQGSIPIPPGFVHLDFGIQALIGVQTLSNALRVTVGGGL